MKLIRELTEDFKDIREVVPAYGRSYNDILKEYFNHPDTWDEINSLIYCSDRMDVVGIYNDTIAPDSQLGAITTYYDLNGKPYAYGINREYY